MQNKHILVYSLGIGIIAASVLFYFIESNDAKEEKFIMNAPCDSLLIYVEAFEEGKTLFAYWTFETQETVNLKITEKNVEIARNAFDNRGC